jgi:hypothetical protein
MIHVHDPTDNDGRGWKRLTDEDLVELLYIAIRLVRAGVRRDLSAREASRADAAARIIAREVVERLRYYPVFGPARPADGPSCGASGPNPCLTRELPDG